MLVHSKGHISLLHKIFKWKTSCEKITVTLWIYREHIGSAHVLLCLCSAPPSCFHSHIQWSRNTAHIPLPPWGLPRWPQLGVTCPYKQTEHHWNFLKCLTLFVLCIIYAYVLAPKELLCSSYKNTFFIFILSTRPLCFAFKTTSHR